MFRSVALIRRRLRPRLILAMMPFVAFVAQAGKALAGITCQDVITGPCQFKRTDFGMTCTRNDCFWPPCWKHHPCDANRYQNTVSGLYYWTGRTNCSPAIDTDTVAWTYSCSNGAGW